jgi:hypothetical protein
MEMPGVEPGAFHMQSERSTTELHPPNKWMRNFSCLCNFVKAVHPVYLLTIQLLRCNPCTTE